MLDSDHHPTSAILIPSLSIESAEEARLTSSAMLALRAASSRQLALSVRSGSVARANVSKCSRTYFSTS